MIILISRVFDVFSDFFIGYFTEKRFIKGLPKKNQILLGIFIFIFSIIGLYVIQPDNYYWFIFYYNLALISYSIAIIPYDSIVIDQKKIQHRRFYIAATKEIFTILAESADIINNNKTFLNLLALIIDENPQIFKQFIKNSIQIFNSDHNKDNAYQDQLKKVIEKTNCDEVLLFSKNYLDMRNKISLEKFKLWFDNSSIHTNSKEKGLIFF